MKRFCLLFLLIAVITISCNKETGLPANTPQWLRDQIAYAENQIKTDSKSGYRIAAWYSYQYNGQHYYEQKNPVSDVAVDVRNQAGQAPSTNIDFYKSFDSGKCCKTLIWKGPDYQDLGSK